jgi:hypothetical protein
VPSRRYIRILSIFSKQIAGFTGGFSDRGGNSTDSRQRAAKGQCGVTQTSIVLYWFSVKWREGALRW